MTRMLGLTLKSCSPTVGSGNLSRDPLLLAACRPFNVSGYFMEELFANTLFFRLFIAGSGGLGSFMVMAAKKPKNLPYALSSLFCGVACALFFALPVVKYTPVLDVTDPDTVLAAAAVVGMLGIFIVQSIVMFAQGEQTPLGKLAGRIWTGIGAAFTAHSKDGSGEDKKPDDDKG